MGCGQRGKWGVGIGVVKRTHVTSGNSLPWICLLRSRGNSLKLIHQTSVRIRISAPFPRLPPPSLSLSALSLCHPPKENGIHFSSLSPPARPTHSLYLPHFNYLNYHLTCTVPHSNAHQPILFDILIFLYSIWGP